MLKPFVLAIIATGLLFSGCCKESAEAVKCPACEACKPCDTESAKTKAEDPANEAKPKDAKMAAVEETNDINEVYAFLKATKTYYIATVENDQPRVRPFGTIDLFEGKLYIQSGKKKNVAKQIAINPKVEIVAYDGQGKWMRVAAELEGDARIEAQKHMLEAYPELGHMYQPGDGNNIVYALKNVTATVSSFGKDDRVIKF